MNDRPIEKALQKYIAANYKGDSALDIDQEFHIKAAFYTGYSQCMEDVISALVESDGASITSAQKAARHDMKLFIDSLES